MLETSAVLIYLVNTMSADALAPKVTRTTAGMIPVLLV